MRDHSRDYPRVVTALPGPRGEAIIARDRAWSSPSYIKEYPLVAATGRGAMVEDVDGNRFIDWMAGIAVSSTGYNHPKVVAAVQEAAGKFLHICGTDFYYATMADLCERLGRSFPGGDKARVFLTNSGTEAIEGAVKLARHHTRKQYILSFRNAFHGRSYAAMSLGASKVKYRAHFGPLLPGVYHLPYDDPYRGPYDTSAADDLFRTTVAPGEIAAVMLEPIQGEGGYIFPRPEFHAYWRKFCDEHGALLIHDEVQSGVGRTGKLWACEQYGVTPDVICSAKGLGSGMPIGAIIAREAAMTWGSGTHGSTFGGNPVACAAALATLDAVEGGLMANATAMGERLLAGLRAMQQRHPCIGDVRGMGLMIGVEFVLDRKTKQPATALVAALEQHAFRKGLLLLSCGQSTIRVAPPLVLDSYDVDRGLEIFESALSEVEALHDRLGSLEERPHPVLE